MRAGMDCKTTFTIIRPVMKIRLQNFFSRGVTQRNGWTLLEMMIGIGIASLVFAAVAMLTVYTARAFAGLANYDDLDRYSRNALDTITREIRQTRGVVAFQTNAM